MDTIIEVIDEKDINNGVLKKAGEILKNGGLVAFPTETVYGLGGDAFNPDSSRKIYEAKGRPSDNPLIVHIATMEDLPKVAADIPEKAYALADKFWPGPLTMIFNKVDALPKETTGGLDTVAVRFPVNPIAMELIKQGGGFIAAPSANRSGRPSPTIAKYVVEDLDGRVEMIIDGGASVIGLESTIVDMTVDPPMILRPGFITKEDIEEALKADIDVDKTIIDGNSTSKPKAPGMKYRHYAPKADMTLVSGSPEDVVKYINDAADKDMKNGLKVGILATDENASLYKAHSIKNLGQRMDEKAIAHNLFRLLREFDDENINVIYAESFETKGVFQATMNRMLKAAGHKEVKL